jgi:hypothetical protein
LDNTANSTATLDTSLGSITVNNWNAKVFTTPASGALTLSALKMGLYESSGPISRNVSVSLFAVNGSNDPTGSALAAESFTLSLATTSAYYDLDLTDSLWALTPSTTYALVVKSDAPSTSTSWTAINPNTVYSGSGGYTFVANRRTTNAGTSWGANGYYNSLLIAAVVPEPQEYAAAVATLLCAFGIYREQPSR